MRAIHFMIWQLRGWYKKDDVVAEWKKVKNDMCLHVHCFVSGPNPFLDLAAEFRYHIFSKEMPLVCLPSIYIIPLKHTINIRKWFQIIKTDIRDILHGYLLLMLMGERTLSVNWGETKKWIGFYQKIIFIFSCILLLQGSISFSLLYFWKIILVLCLHVWLLVMSMAGT